MHSCNLLKNRVSACARRLEAAWLIRLKDTFTWRICSGLEVQESDFHGQYIFMEGPELANLDMVRRITSVTGCMNSLWNAPVRLCERDHEEKLGGGAARWVMTPVA